MKELISFPETQWRIVENLKTVLNVIEIKLSELTIGIRISILHLDGRNGLFPFLADRQADRQRGNSQEQRTEE